MVADMERRERETQKKLLVRDVPEDVSVAVPGREE
jgi:hypothetical protein